MAKIEIQSIPKRSMISCVSKLINFSKDMILKKSNKKPQSIEAYLLINSCRKLTDKMQFHIRKLLLRHHNRER